MLHEAAIRKRRMKKIRELKSKSNRFVSSDYHDGRNERVKFEEAFPRYGGMNNSPRNTSQWIRPFPTSVDGLRAIKWVLSICIVIFVFAVYQLPNFQNSKTQYFISEVMERDFNFEGVAVWYEETFGSSLQFIPAFQSRKGETEKVKSNTWAVPVAGMMNMPAFNQQASLIQSKPSQEVYATEGGWVTQVEEVEGSGLTVVIQHSTDTQSTYGLLGEAEVKVNDWVTKGQKIGLTKEDKLYFSIQKNGEYVDPNGVILVD